ncbi:MAG: amidohydrolase [Victivallaceae bacterium]|nr:amidohydrolase [Victivallaceae bacterium]
MSEILIKNAWFNGSETDLLLKGNRIAGIGSGLNAADGAKVIDGTGKAVLPPFYNTHSHAAMTLLRGYADDMELFKWLNEYIWPIEAKLTAEDVYIGTRLAILEMIKSGTVFFNDMYWLQLATVRAAEDMKVRAAVGVMFLEDASGQLSEANRLSNEELLAHRGEFSERIILTLAPHAIYTVSESGLRRCAELSVESGMPVHMHLSETKKEVADCRAAHNGMSPVEYIGTAGLLNRNLIAAHCVAFDDRDFAIFAEAGGVISHMPCSNSKLASGCFDLARAIRHGCRVTIGTDGCASNNNLSMMDEMKFAALNAKLLTGDPAAAPAPAVYDIGTRSGAAAFGLDAGVIAEGKLADLILVDMNNTLLCGGNLISDMVYSADTSCVDTVICDGNVLMEHRKVENEEEIVTAARDCRRRLTGK